MVPNGGHGMLKIITFLNNNDYKNDEDKNDSNKNNKIIINNFFFFSFSEQILETKYDPILYIIHLFAGDL